MYKRILVFLVVIFSSICMGYSQKEGAKILFDTLVHDFGVLQTSLSYKYDFAYTNKGDSPLVILSAKVSCPCTKVKWNKKPLMPGGSEAVSVTYSSKDRGTFMKEITITTNAQNKVTYIIIKGRVE